MRDAHLYFGGSSFCCSGGSFCRRSLWKMVQALVRYLALLVVSLR
jgi:hypothetical protein